MVKATEGGERYHWVDGHYVEEDALRIAEKIHDYDPNLKVQFLDYAASIGDAPFRVVEICKDGVERTVCYAWRLDDSLIEKVYQADTRRLDVLANIAKKNAAKERDEQRRYMDLAEEQNKMANAILKSSKDTYTLPVGDKHILKVSSTEPAKVVDRPRK